MSSASYGGTALLQSMTQTTTNLATSFTYDGSLQSGTSGELTQVTLPYGGTLGWQYQLFGHAVQSLREVQTRTLNTSARGGSGTTYNYSITHDPSDPSRYAHASGILTDSAGNGQKVWYFQADGTQFNAGLQVGFDNKQLNTNQIVTHEDYTWAQDSLGRPYLASTVTTQDGVAQKKSTQAMDSYGNVTQTQLYDWGNLATPVRTYSNTYSATYPNYTPFYIFNRLLTSTVTGPGGSPSVTLASNRYDQSSVVDVPGITQHDPKYGISFFPRGNLSNSSMPGGSTIANYDIAGNPTSTYVNGVATTIATNVSTNWAVPSAMTTNSLTSTMNWTSFLAPSSQAGPNGDTIWITYDPSARPQTTTSSFGAVTTYAYNDAASPPAKTATTNGRWVRTTSDGFGRTIKTETGDGGGTKSIVDTQYAACGCSPLGKMVKQSQPYAPGGTVYWTTFNYDGTGRTLTKVAPDGSTTSYSYVGTTVTVTDPAGKWKKFTMDGLGNLAQVQEPDPGLGTVATNYSYDVLNHLVTVSMPRGGTTQTRTFNYGNPPGAYLLSATNPENGTVTYSYSGSLLTAKTDAKGQVLKYAYDNYNRVTTLSLGGTAPYYVDTVLRTYSYDTNPYDGSYSQNAFGRLAAVQYNGLNGDVFTDMFSYTGPGSMAGKRLQVTRTPSLGGRQSASLATAYTYDNEGRMSSTTYPTTYDQGDGSNPSALNPRPIPGPAFSYTFDSMGRANGMNQSGTAVVSNVQYGPANELLQMTYGVEHPFTETHAYNSLLQITQFNGVQYGYRAGANNGKIATQTTSGETVAYAYDSLNRLISAASSVGPGSSQTFGYDGFGNLVSKPPLSVNVDAGNHITSLNYDANGNVTYQPGTATYYAYDAENRMTGVPGMQYGYDGQNKRNYAATFDTNGNVVKEEFYFYGADGKKIGTYYLQQISVGSVYNTTLTFTYVNPKTGANGPAPMTYFRGRLVGTDRLGSVGNYYPYGEDKAAGTSSNLAVGKTASQSSTYSGYASTVAGSAVDGNTDGNFFDNSVTHTNSDTNAWWQVDLGVSATVNSVVIWNRTDCCAARLSDYWVFVSNTPFSPSDTPATLQNRAGTWSSHQTVAPNPSVTIAAGGTQGRYVRVQLSGTDYLSLAEVQVMGTAGASSNLAFAKPATQSSTYPGYASAAAGSAVDGNTDGAFGDGSVTATNSDTNAWWQVDLGASATVNSVVIWNRTDCCAARLSDYWVFVSNTPFSPSDTPATLQNRAGTWSSHQTVAPSPSVTIAVGSVLSRYVRVQLSGTDFLSLAEVQVMAAASAGGPNPPNDNVKFATYTRDAATGLDYADQRYYSSQFGRFMSADRYMASGGPGDPGSWNRYAYTRGDPVNRVDPSGLQDCNFGSDICVDVWGLPQIGFQFDFGDIIARTFALLDEQIAAGLAQLSMPLSERLSESEDRVRKDLSKTDCAKDFKDINAVLNKIGQIKLKDQGLPQFRTVNGEIQSVTSGPALA